LAAARGRAARGPNPSPRPSSALIVSVATLPGAERLGHGQGERVIPRPVADEICDWLKPGPVRPARLGSWPLTPRPNTGHAIAADTNRSNCHGRKHNC